MITEVAAAPPALWASDFVYPKLYVFFFSCSYLLLQRTSLPFHVAESEEGKEFKHKS